MTNAEHVWIIPAWYGDEWWTEEDSDIACSVEEMTAAILNSTYLMVDFLYLSQKHEPTVSGFVSYSIQYKAMKKGRLVNYASSCDNAVQTQYNVDRHRSCSEICSEI